MNTVKLIFYSLAVSLITISVSIAGITMQQERYKHESDKKVEYQESNVFVICEGCEGTSPLTKRVPPKLAIKFSGDKEKVQKPEDKKVIHYQAPESVPFTVYFGYDKHEISVKEKDNLQGLAEMLIKDGYNEFEAVGFTDKKGSREYNLMLSSRRAERVTEILTSLGATPSKTEGRGKCCTHSSDDESRRVEIKFMKKGGI